ncbi:MAG TPA: CDP-alcohol phosphatidyltransferase family protein [Luteolibacter sp.]|nr:CDP-alcohol phosphatidyltransferase family protein [Luteolibacter sp.]
MTFASKITLTRLLMVPVFAVFAIYYGASIKAGTPVEWLRWTALAIFVTAAASDGIDGWVARRFNQRSKFGAFIDPLADKTLLLTGITVLAAVDWGPNGWKLPVWFSALVIVRDIIIVAGLAYLHHTHHKITIKPHWSGKVCTVAQMFALGWVMLRIYLLPPIYPCVIAAVFTVWSAVAYIRQGFEILHESGHARE